MKQKTILSVCLTLMILSFGWGMADRFYFTPAAQAAYSISLWMLLDVFAARPIFYGCLGVLSGWRLFGKVKQAQTRKILLICGIALSVLFLAVAIPAIAQVEFTVLLFELIRQLFQLPAVFLVPGILIGLGLGD